MNGGAILDRLDKGPEFRFSGPVFETRDQIRAAALEEAGRRLDLLARGARDDGDDDAACVLDDAATEVRALREVQDGDN